MKTTTPLRIASLFTMAMALSSSGQAQTLSQARLAGEIDAYTALADPAGPWHVTGEWTLILKGDSGKGDFFGALGMVRSQNPAPAAHTHHVTIIDGDVTPLANGFQISGTAVITSNGNVAGFSGSPVDFQITGGNGLRYSNASVTFAGAAASHFGELPIHGVVTSRR